MCYGKMKGILIAFRATGTKEKSASWQIRSYFTVCPFTAQLPYSNYSRPLKFRMGFLSRLLSCAIVAQPLLT